MGTIGFLADGPARAAPRPTCPCTATASSARFRTTARAFTQGLHRPERRLLRRHRPERPLRHPQGQDRDRRGAAEQAARRGVLRRGDHRLERLAHPDHVAVGDRVRLRHQHVRADQDLELQGRGLGADPGRHADHHERRHARSCGSSIPRRSRRPAGSPSATRSGPVDRLNELEYVKGEIFANIWTDRPHRADLAEGRPRHRLDRSDRSAVGRRARHDGRRAQRHRLRRRRRSAVRHGEAVAASVRNQAGEEGEGRS